MSETKAEREPEAGSEPEVEGGAPATGEPVGAAAGPRPGKLQQLLVEYGVIGIVVLLSISGLTYLGFVVAIMAGLEVEGAGETAGVLVAAGVAWAATKPIRIPVAIALTPVVAAIWHRIRGKAPRKA
jgi:hypothetical protein